MSRPEISPAGDRIYEGVIAYHQGDEENGWPLLHLCEAYARTLAKVNEALRHDEIGSGRRRMYDPERAAVWLLNWQLQHSGGEAPVQVTNEQLRTLARDAPWLKRGTLPAFTAVGRQQLADPENDLLHIFEKADGRAYRLVVSSYTSMVDADRLRAALLQQKPIGLVLQVAVYDGWVVGVIEASTEDYPTIGDLEDAFDTVAELEEHIPA